MAGRSNPVILEADETKEARRNDPPGFCCIRSTLDIEIHVHDGLDGLGIIGDVGVAVNGVLDDGAGHSEVDHIHGLVVSHHGIDQTGGKGVAAADTVENVEGEERAFKGMALIPHEG